MRITDHLKILKRKNIMKSPVTVSVLMLAILVGGSLIAADKAPMNSVKSQKKYSHRLPNNYGKIGIDTSQRNKIYAIQANYRSKKEALLEELEDLRTQQNLEIQTVLTKEQMAELKSLLDVSQKKRDAARASRKK